MNAINATKVRNEWSAISELVIREKPAFIKKTRDYMFLSDIKTIEFILSAYSFTADIYDEDDHTVTISLVEIDLIENGVDEQDAIRKMGRAILDYAEDYYNEFSYWARGSRKAHLPYILKALILNDQEKIGEVIQCRRGKI
jgi:hypothetical protein